MRLKSRLKIINGPKVGSGSVYLVGAALFTIFVKGAGLYAPDWNR